MNLFGNHSKIVFAFNTECSDRNPCSQILLPVCRSTWYLSKSFQRKLIFLNRRRDGIKNTKQRFLGFFCFCFFKSLFFYCSQVEEWWAKVIFVSQHSLGIFMDLIMVLVAVRLLGKCDWSARVETVWYDEEKLATAKSFQKWCDENKAAVVMTEYLQNKDVVYWWK